jgi:hypothetical protein
MNLWLTVLPMWAIQRLRFLSAGIAGALLVSCGGNDGDATHYHSVAMAGERIGYKIDTTNLTYTYTIAESQFGLAGSTGSGTLTSNSDGSYTPSGAPDARVIILPNGLMLGAVRERFGADVVTTPIIGIKDPVTSIAELAADYNYVQRGCASAVCSVSRGTLRIEAASEWRSCRGGNLVAGACTGAAENGTLESRGAGLWRMRSDDGTDIGTVMGFSSGGQHVLIVDLKDRRVGGAGIGMLVGGQQMEMSTAMTDGTWISAMSSGHWFGFTATGSDIAISQFDWLPVNLAMTFIANDPWTGMATTSWGETGFMSGAGVFMLETLAGDVELGVKLP